MKVAVTGGAGFLGSHYLHQTLRGRDTQDFPGPPAQVINLDALTYAGDLRRLTDLAKDPPYRFIEIDITNEQAVEKTMSELRPDVVVHYAADSHVTRSERDPARFYRTNLEGTRVLLDVSVAHGVERFIHISTDEVYGPIHSGAFKEEDKRDGDEQASSAYAKSKSLADDLARSYAEKLAVVVARPTNAFGPWQFPEKAFPRWAARGLRGEDILVWGDGLQVRQWLYAEDFADAIGLLVERGEPGEVYNVGPTHEPEITNIDLARWLAEKLDLSSSSVKLTEYDRPDHDRRYAVDSSKIRALGWQPGDVWSQFADTLEWYRSNRSWWESHIEEAESIYSDSVQG